MHQALAQRAMQLEVVGLQHHARVGAPPQYRLIRVEPGENSQRVSPQQCGYIQHTASRQQPGSVIVVVPGTVQWRKTLPGSQPGQEAQWMSHGSVDHCGVTTLNESASSGAPVDGSRANNASGLCEREVQEGVFRQRPLIAKFAMILEGVLSPCILKVIKTVV